MKILILGGDGYLGWPTAMHLAAKGHDVAVVDNYLRRNLAREENVEPLDVLPNLVERSRIFSERVGYHIRPYIGDLRSWDFISSVFRQEMPDGVVHYAEQPSAPYSMLNRRAAMLTLMNNLEVTANLIHCVHEIVPRAHIVKLGTMGEYGTPNIDIEEGWIEIQHKGRSDRFLFPRQAGSNYHTTKIMDTDYLWFYVRTWKLAVTDLMQGPVYGILTKQTRLDDRLQTHFAYDEIFGTVLNRFVVQAVAGHPLTIYGRGGQTRGYINLVDTLSCIQLSLEQPAAPGELRVFNQFVETFSVNELGERVREAGAKIGLDVKLENIPNPRLEREEHYYNPAHTGLSSLGLKSHPLTIDALVEMMEWVRRRQNGIDPRKFIRKISWV